MSPTDRYSWAARFSVRQFQGILEAGILTAEDRVELLEGYPLIKPDPGPDHYAAVDHIRWAIDSLPPGWQLREGPAVVLADSRLEPDFAIVRERNPSSSDLAGADVGLIIDLASTPLLRDQTVPDRTRSYARAGIVCYWIINLVDRRVEVYTQPSGPTAVPAYGTFQTFQPGDAVPLVLDGNTVASVPVADLLP
jgi:hypothetical protein